MNARPCKGVVLLLGMLWVVMLFVLVGVLTVMKERHARDLDEVIGLKEALIEARSNQQAAENNAELARAQVLHLIGLLNACATSGGAGIVDGTGKRYHCRIVQESST